MVTTVLYRKAVLRYCGTAVCANLVQVDALMQVPVALRDVGPQALPAAVV